jgi:hypothetical protein
MVAETAIIHEAAKLGIPILRPIDDARYDLVFELPAGFLRVQCKWSPRFRDVIVVRSYSNRRASEGLRRRVYTSEEIDLVAVYCPDNRQSYALPGALFSGRSQIFLRLEPSRNNQRNGIHWARDYEFAARLSALGPIAQLGERRHGMAEAVGSSPTGSISKQACA